MNRKPISPSIYPKPTSKSSPHFEKKTTHNVSTTPTAWEGLQDFANQLGCSSVSDFLEQIGRHQFHISRDVVENRSDITTELKEMEGRLREFLDTRINNINTHSSLLE